jgi:voltage-gated potassium channel
MLGLDSRSVLRDRILAASAALLGVFLVGTFGLYFLGQVYLEKQPWSLGECAFFTVTTITTVGFHELPHLGRVPFGHIFTSFILLVGLGVALYCASALTTYFIEGEFTKGRLRRRMARMIDRLHDHIIVCGIGTTGLHVAEELLATGHPLVAIDLEASHLERLQAISPNLIPTIQGDATEDTVLEHAGIRRARGLVAAITDDKSNLFVVLSARQLNPGLKIVAPGVDVQAGQ